MKLLAVLKSILLWSYERGTWQYDVLCLVILAFIFLTPSSWFNRPSAGSTSPPGMERRETSPPARASDPTSERRKNDARIPPAPAIDR